MSRWNFEKIDDSKRLSVFKINGWYYRGAIFWRWTRWERFAAKLPEQFWMDWLVPKYTGRPWRIISKW